MSRQSSLPATPTPPPDPNSIDDYDSSYDSDGIIDEILDKYHFEFRPEIRVKFKRRIKDLALCACYSKPHHREPRWRFTAKPTDQSPDALARFVGKLLVEPTTSTAALYSKKIYFSVFRLQMVLAYNLQTRTPGLDYRIVTKWGDGPRIKRKEQFKVSDCCLLRAKWNLELDIPELQGHIGGHRTERQLQTGGMNFEISQMDVVLDL